MPSQIQILDDNTINQIAAGEVIENAASCIKELVENAIDASSDQIEVHFMAGGRKKIEVIDNGLGMSFDDALLSLERHATSKIRKLIDMDQIETMGFRGEALPSIASISKLTLETSDEKSATKILCYGGKLIEHSVSTRTRGTTIEVSSLFYNVPARKEFQKSLAHDSREIIKVIMNLALAYPLIAFKLTQDGKEVFNLIPKNNLGELENLHLRIEKLFGSQLSNDLIELDIEKNGAKLTGFISKPKMHRPNKLGQHLFVNRRFIDSRLISVGVREGYSTRLPEGRFPLFFLSMQLDPKRIDVNVHPQKKEIRFKEPFEIKNLITSIIDEALRKSSLPSHVLRPAVKKEVFFEPTFHSIEPYRRSTQEVNVIEKEEECYFPDPTLDFIPNIIGIFSPYIFVEAKSISSQMSLKQGEENGLLMVHQRRADERILFDALVERGSQLSVQSLLLPETLEFSEVDSRIIEEYLPVLQTLGISIRSIGQRSYLLDGLPSLMPSTTAHNLIESVLEEVRRGASKSFMEEQKKQLLALAISKSVHFSKIEDKNKASILITKLFKCENFEYSPKGKPIILPLSLEEMDKKFK